MDASPRELAYAAAMVGLLAVAIGVSVRVRDAVAITTRGYRGQLLHPVRLGAFAVALVVFVVVAPYTGDPTWDAVDAAFMSVGCFVTAPWACATVYRVLARRARAIELVLALVAWWWTASASYDLYLLARDGGIPLTSGANAVASTILYVLGGLFFSIGVDRERGLVFVFMDARWPAWSGDAWTAKGLATGGALALALATPVIVFLVWAVMSELGALP